eukprot:gene10785-14481_t
MSVCSLISCGLESRLRCSRCHQAYYCCVEHQKSDWSIHRKTCSSPDIKIKKLVSNLDSQISVISGNPESSLQEKESRNCRCMFCGENLILNSEEESVNHMRVCVALQEQLASKEQFTIPSILKDRLPKGNPG